MTTRIRRDGFARAAEPRGWIKADGSLNAKRIGEAIGMHKSTVARILTGEYEVSDGFVGRILMVTGATFNELFQRVAGPEDDDTDRDMALPKVPQNVTDRQEAGQTATEGRLAS